MLILIYEHVYSLFINKFDEDNCAKHVKNCFFVTLKGENEVFLKLVTIFSYIRMK